MAFIENRENLKKHFVTNALPTEEHFANLIDAFVHKKHEEGDNVGIGTDTPVNTIDINGNMVIGSEFAGEKIAPDDGLLVEGYMGTGLDVPSEQLHVDGNVRIDNGGLMIDDAIIISHDRKWLGDKAGLKGDQGEPGEQGPEGAEGQPGSPGSSGTSSWKDSSGKVTTTENVGIGTNNPDTTLEVNGYVTKKQVGFTVYGFNKIDKEGRIVFNQEITNESDGWDHNKSEFVAPQKGVYFFCASIAVPDIGGQAKIILIKDNNKSAPVITIWDSADRTQMGTSSLVIPLSTKEKISIQVQSDDPKTKVMITKANFSGYRL